MRTSSCVHLESLLELLNVTGTPKISAAFRVPDDPQAGPSLSYQHVTSASRFNFQLKGNYQVLC
jgi:hypothetical protein